MARRLYNQKSITLTIDGVQIQDFFEGTTITYIRDGGEVDKTQGTDGAGINLATNQGATLRFTVRETSRSQIYLSALRLRQENGGNGSTIIIRTGNDILLSMTDAFMGRPGELTTGDKKMAGVEYTFMSAQDAVNNETVVQY